VPGLNARDGKPMPGLSTADFKGNVTLVNVWASWCVPCHDEAPLLEALSADKRIRIVGINYKDQPDNARRFLGRYGNPFVAAGADGKRPRLDGMGRLRRAGNLHRRTRRHHRLQAGRTDHRGQSRRVIKPEIEKALAKN
jgi:cytochrome c biogenesis protein CcmG/thiol:disulfide interchange protein DsbE